MSPLEPTVAPQGGQPRPFRLWMALFVLSWLPIFVALAEQARLTLNPAFWTMLSTFSPKIIGLRLFWYISIPVTGATLIAAAAVLFARPPYAALFVAGAFLWVIVLNVGELATIALINRTMVETIATTMQLRTGDLGGPLQTGIGLSLAGLVYKTSCLVYLHQGRQVRVLFGPVTWRRLRLWVVSVLEGEDWRDEAAV